MVEKFVGIIVAQSEHRLRQPTFFKESTPHFSIISIVGQATGRRKKELNRPGSNTPWNMTSCVEGQERISVLRRGPGFGTMLHWIEEHA
jgi:hypothetical protein